MAGVGDWGWGGGEDRVVGWDGEAMTVRCRVVAVASCHRVALYHH